MCDAHDIAQLQCTVDVENGTTVVRVRGELDGAAAHDIQRSLRHHAIADAIDMSGVTFIDAMGLRLLVEWHRMATAHDREFTLLTPTAVVRRILHTTGLESVFKVDE